MTLETFDPKTAGLKDWEKTISWKDRIILENKKTGMQVRIHKVKNSYRVWFIDPSGYEPYDETFEKVEDAINAFTTMEGKLW